MSSITIPKPSSVTLPGQSQINSGIATPKGPFPDIEYKSDDTGWKRHYFNAFDWEFRRHLWNHLVECNGREQQILSGREEASGSQNKTATRTRLLADFVHLFGAPLFIVVAANWARLVVRRSFDLDLLEWRPQKDIQAETVEEIKSRRVAITRHQRDISASLEILRGLTQEEQIASRVTRYGKNLPDSANAAERLKAFTLAMIETSEGNKGHSNYFVTDSNDVDSWEMLYSDFFELKASMDALEKRADKIQDGMLGLMNARLLETQAKLLETQTKLTEQADTSKKQSEWLNYTAFTASVLLIPFTVVGTIFSINFTKGGPSKDWWSFLIAMLFTFFGAVLLFLGIRWKYRGSKPKKGFFLLRTKRKRGTQGDSPA